MSILNFFLAFGVESPQAVKLLNPEALPVQRCYPAEAKGVGDSTLLCLEPASGTTRELLPCSGGCMAAGPVLVLHAAVFQSSSSQDSSQELNMCCFCAGSARTACLAK